MKLQRMTPSLSGSAKISKVLLVAFVAANAWGQDQRPLPAQAPQAIAARARVHVRAHEDLDPDRLRTLSRPGVTLWLSTKSNTLRASTLENIGRFDTAWVQLRSPLKKVDAQVFSKLPNAGLWVSSDALDIARRIPGVRRVAVTIRGSLSESLVGMLRAAHVSEVRWVPTEPVDLFSWSQFRQLPGRRVVAVNPEELLAVKCAERTTNNPAIEVHVASMLALSSDAFPCSAGARVVVEPKVETWLLQSLLVRDPSVELVVDVGSDAERALVAQAMFDRLELGAFR